MLVDKESTQSLELITPTKGKVAHNYVEVQAPENLTERSKLQSLS